MRKKLWIIAAALCGFGGLGSMFLGRFNTAYGLFLLALCCLGVSK